RRYALLLSILVMSAGLFALSLFIWDMNVYGNEKIPKERIMRELGELGVGIGTLRRNIDSKELQNRMILRIPELEWLAVNVKGSRASVEVREKEPKPDIIARNVPCNIVARKAGLITSINTLEGAAAVTVGQAVEEGQLLVSGLVNSNIIGMRQVHAMAEVTARTWYEYTSVIPSYATGKNYTGREKKRGAIVIAGRRFNLYWGKSETVNADKTVDRKTLSIGGSFTLPLVWVVETLTEYEPTQYKISYDSADAYMKYSLGLRLNDESEGGEVLSVSSLTTELDMVYQCEMTAECLESVAVTVIMP
ncbi:MAG: sporulation protein YqfD, partial [Oscillospiraceae bacterium]|nr:sporulation protein YqfD [Oscillospiraceae bacterium]